MKRDEGAACAQVCIHQAEGQVTLDVSGPLSVSAAELLIEVLDGEDPEAEMTIDLSQTTFSDSRALHFLVDELEGRCSTGRRIGVRGSGVRLLRLTPARPSVPPQSQVRG
ncbi:STAS domain-containing protein [Occultella gossypii]|uniref:STAS domain-containing protein n=1 Tax=Occultella gossypii TaxID=2800820 RepID=A0ABS7SG95_9MICO|nr:hypothetical protein [Occultella gossypii]MBZ2199077.1 hypothetical protein [Occultella gossypii]